MRCHPGSFRLSFLLLAGVSADRGSHQPSPEGCVLEVTAPLVAISGPSREAVFEHATSFLRLSCRGLPPVSIAATLETPALPSWLGGGRSDTWSIIVGADVAFSPTALDPHFPTPSDARPPPALAIAARGLRR